jgi:hypothetical protein
VARKDREKRNIEEELKDRAEEATRDREAIRELKVSHEVYIWRGADE